MNPNRQPGPLRLSCSAFEAFERCRRRFELASLRGLDWPGLSQLDLPANSEQGRLGRAFHRLVGDWLAGREIDPGDIGASDPALERLWRRFSDSPPAIGDSRLFVEQEIAVKVGNAVVLAKPDLVWQNQEGRVTIIDWKTSTSSAAVELVESSCQARLYPYLVVEAASAFGIGPCEPAHVEMVFYFVNDPEHGVRIQHSAERHRSVEEWLRGRVDEIMSMSDFPMTTDLSECARCRYQTYCHPGGVTVRASPDEEELEPVGLDYLDYF